MPKATNFFNDAKRLLSYMWKRKGKGSGRISKFFGWIGREMRRE
jgi:hypothetical protein